VKNPKNPLIYIIDKSAAYRLQLKASLAAISLHNLQFFDNTEACLDFGGVPDIIILDDIQENECMSGIDFLRIYQNRYRKSIFLFLSTNNNLDDAVSAIKLGATDYVVKSKVGLNRLTRRIDKLVQSQLFDSKKKKFLKTAVFFLGTFSFLLATAIILYNL